VSTAQSSQEWSLIVGLESTRARSGLLRREYPAPSGH
jgi:hypothetical protein